MELRLDAAEKMCLCSLAGFKGLDMLFCVDLSVIFYKKQVAYFKEWKTRDLDIYVTAKIKEKALFTENSKIGAV